MTSVTHLLIRKSDGDSEPFDVVKLERSLEAAGASSVMRAKVTAHVIKELTAGMTTDDIYRHAFELLKKEEKTPIAARYSIKRAVFSLGPSGFPFESFLSEILRTKGYSTRTGVTLLGRCVTHEVDVVGEKDGKRIAVEAKFHNDPSGKTDVRDALYVHARVEDLQKSPDPHSHVNEGWLITNTRFTANAIHYAQCVGLTLLGWDFPAGRGIFKMIEDGKVHPLTCLTTLSESEKQRMLERRVVLCKHVQNETVLRDFGVRPDKIPAVLEEARQLCVI